MTKKHSNPSPKKKLLGAFTIPELLVIAAVIVTLLSITLVALAPGRAKSRDAKRVSEVNTMRIALQMHYVDHGKYPKSTPDEEWCSVEGTGERSRCLPSFFNRLRPYLPEIPGDPLFGKEKEPTGKLYSYQYISTSSGAGYKLHTDLETRDPYEIASWIGNVITYVPPGSPESSGPEEFACDIFLAAQTDWKVYLHEYEGTPTLVGNAMLSSSVHAADLDADGDIDVVAAAMGEDKVYWYENNSDGSYTKHGYYADQPEDVFTIDVDGDTDIDILASNWNPDTVSWYRNNGELDPSFTALPVYVGYGGSFSVSGIDLNEDGYIDVISTGGEPGTGGHTESALRWHKNDGSENFETYNIYVTPHDIHVNPPGFYDHFAIDLDDDGNIDILLASTEEGKELRWFKNDGLENFEEKIIDTPKYGVNSVFAIDLDDDGDIDVISSETLEDRASWFENDGSENFEKHILTSSATFARGIYAIDVDGDIDIDILLAAKQDDELIWFKNDGQADPSFTTHVVANVDGPEAIYALPD